ncbi:MAG: hypothetical protein QOD03_1259, partial [Verrucomicrobiota bacterium]
MVQILLDGGDDVNGVPSDDVRLLLSGQTPGDWNLAVHMSRELLSYYKVYDAPLLVDQLVVALFCAYALSLSGSAGIADFWTYNDALIQIMAKFGDELLATENVVIALSHIYQI